MDILSSAVEIDRLYREHDAAEQKSFEARRACEQTMARVDGNFTALTHVMPSTLEETVIISAVLAGRVLDSTIPDEGDCRDEIDRMINNLLRGLTHQLGPNLGKMPKWVRDCARVSESQDE